MKSHSINIDPSALERINALRQKSGQAGNVLRISISGGGCSGFKYELALTSDIADDDVVFEGAVVVDPVSLEMLAGTTLRFIDDLSGAQFVLDNPNAESGCGCGASFSIRQK